MRINWNWLIPYIEKYGTNLLDSDTAIGLNPNTVELAYVK